MGDTPDRCPACEIRTIEDEDGILYGRQVRCTHGTGCVRAREARIREAREAVLEQARQWWEMHSSSNLVGHNPFVTAIKAMVAAEAEGDR